VLHYVDIIFIIIMFGGIRHASGRADDETTRQSTICMLSLLKWQ
jgi:hypothetical protein